MNDIDRITDMTLNGGYKLSDALLPGWSKVFLPALVLPVMSTMFMVSTYFYLKDKIK